MSDLSGLLKLAETAALEAGKRLASGSEYYQQVNSNELKDIKLQADIESEQLIRDMLGQSTEFSIIGEEQGGNCQLLDGDELYWIVDPLDGTYNYHRELPMTCVSIGLLRGIKPVLGVIYDFNREELFSGSPETGLFINGKKHCPEWSTSRDKASLATGFPASMDFADASVRQFIEEVRTYKKIRMLGSAALAIVYVALGRVDVYYEKGTRLWDIAAGLALVEAAGACYELTPVDPEKFTFNIWAAGRQDLLE